MRHSSSSSKDESSELISPREGNDAAEIVEHETSVMYRAPQFQHDVTSHSSEDNSGREISEKVDESFEFVTPRGGNVSAKIDDETSHNSENNASPEISDKEDPDYDGNELEEAFVQTKKGEDNDYSALFHAVND